MGIPGGSPRRWPKFLLLFVTLATLWAGLDPKGYRFRNEVEWLEGRPGLRFGNFGRVHTAPFLDEATAASLNQRGFSLMLAFDPLQDSQGGFRVIAAFHSGDNGSQLVIGQWRDYVIVMNGADYNNQRRLPRVTADTSLFSDRPLMLTVTTTTNGTTLYLNTERVATSAKLHLTLPASPKLGRLVLGNSAGANQPWRGEISFLSLLPQPLKQKEVANEYQSWRSGAGWRSDPAAESLLHFRFDEASGESIRNHGSVAEPLTIPPRMHALGARALAWAPPVGASDRSLVLDIVLNLIGFMPFGVAFAAVLFAPQWSGPKVVLAATIAGLGLSLIIELTQAWIPSRDSSLRDLLLNSAGAPLGAWLAVAWRHRFRF